MALIRLETIDNGFFFVPLQNLRHASYEVEKGVPTIRMSFEGLDETRIPLSSVKGYDAPIDLENEVEMSPEAEAGLKSLTDEDNVPEPEFLNANNGISNFIFTRESCAFFQHLLMILNHGWPAIQIPDVKPGYYAPQNQTKVKLTESRVVAQYQSEQPPGITPERAALLEREFGIKS